MKFLQPLSICAVVMILGCSQETQTAEQLSVSPGAMSTLDAQTIEVGCGMCVYNMDDVAGCKLAAVIDGEPMLVKGVKLDMHGHGLCSGSKSAVVSMAAASEPAPGSVIAIAPQTGCGLSVKGFMNFRRCSEVPAAPTADPPRPAVGMRR